MNDQEALWASEFGDEYLQRNIGKPVAEVKFWERALEKVGDTPTILELGANVGNNIRALRRVRPESKIDGLEINHKAFNQLQLVADDAKEGSILEFIPGRTWDLVFTKGVLIHIHPNDLLRACEVIYAASSRYIILSEYFHKTPTSVTYRGQKDALWKRDFGGYFIDHCAISCIDYFFSWSRDRYPQDDLTTWVFEK